MKWLWWGSDISEESEDSWITWKTVVFVGACAGLVYAVSKLVTSVSDTVEKIDEAISSDESSSSDD